MLDGVDPQQIIAGAKAWQVQAKSDFKIGMRRWARDRMWEQPPPTDGQSLQDVFNDPDRESFTGWNFDDETKNLESQSYAVLH